MLSAYLEFTADDFLRGSEREPWNELWHQHAREFAEWFSPRPLTEATMRRDVAEYRRRFKTKRIVDGLDPFLAFLREQKKRGKQDELD